MSTWIVSKTDIDALVSVALRWTETGLIEMQPPAVAAVLAVTPGNADEVGLNLWAANHDSNNYGGPKFMADPDFLKTLNPDRIAVMPTYQFEALPGLPRPQTAIYLAGYYAYQTAGDYWDRYDWPNGEPPFEMLFHQAMIWVAAGLLGIPRGEEPGDYDPYDTPIEDALMDDPVTKASGWGLEDSDRDLFLRLTKI